MSRKPKPKNQLSAGQRAALYVEEQENRRRAMLGEENNSDGKESAEAVDVAMSPTQTTKPAAKKKVLPKPQHAVINVDFSIPAGNLRALSGMCNGPVSFDSDISSVFRDMRVPYVRYNNTDTAVSRYAFDISRIFPDKNADEGDPESYNFDVTDRYIMAAYNCGARVILRLGESDGQSGWALDDPQKWVSVCLHTVKHYNDYWKNGFAYGIKEFEIAPVGNFTGDHKDAAVFDLYGRAAKALKTLDESYLVGGMSFSSYSPSARELVKYCAANRLPLDFISFTSLTDTPEKVFSAVEKYTELLYNLGFSGTKIMLSEWNYIKKISEFADSSLYLENAGGAYSRECREIFEAQKGIVGAAFCSSLMLGLNQYPLVEYATYYDAQPAVSKFCGICDRYGNIEKPFYAFKAYSDIQKLGQGVLCHVEENPEMQKSGVYAAAAVSDKGGMVMISSFDGPQVVDLRLDMIPDNVYNAEIYMSDGVKNLEFCDSVALTGLKKRLLLSMSAYGFAIIKIF